MATKTKSKRFRNFSCVTYLDIDTIYTILGEHQHQLKATAFIEHDKDVNDDGTPKERHVHIILCLHNNTTINAIKNWFNGGYVDDNGNVINTLVQSCSCIQAQYDYLIHKRDLNKYQYDISLRLGWNFDYFENTKAQDDDTLQQAMLDLCEGVPLSVLVQRYGRDFIVHYRSLKLLYCDMVCQEQGINPFMPPTYNESKGDKDF